MKILKSVLLFLLAVIPVQGNKEDLNKVLSITNNGIVLIILFMILVLIFTWSIFWPIYLGYIAGIICACVDFFAHYHDHDDLGQFIHDFICGDKVCVSGWMQQISNLVVFTIVVRGYYLMFMNSDLIVWIERMILF